MDQSWITASRISDEYEKGVEEFLQFTKRNGAGVNNNYFCPCVNCLNVKIHACPNANAVVCGILVRWYVEYQHGFFYNRAGMSITSFF